MVEWLTPAEFAVTRKVSRRTIMRALSAGRIERRGSGERLAP